MREPVSIEVVDIERVSKETERRTPSDTLVSLSGQPASVWSLTTTRIVLAMLAVTLVQQFLLVVAYPPFEGHDEVAHFGYVSTLDRDRRLPTLADNLPPETGPYSRFTLDWPAVYSANHPPLYYLLAWPFYRLAPQDVEARLYAIRLLSVPLFLLVVWLTYLLALTLFPGDRFLAVTAPALVAFQPQLSFEGAIVNNDILAMVIGAALLYLLTDALRRGITADRSLVIGTMLGVGLLTKATLTAFLPVAVGVVVLCAYRSGRAATTHPSRRRSAATHTTLVAVPALAVSLPWFAFLYATYGDVTVFRSLDLLQSTWGAPSSSLLHLIVSLDFHAERFHEGWGYFGWRLLPLSRYELWFVAFVTAFAVAGLALESWRWLRRDVRVIAPEKTAGIAMLAACCLTFYLAMVYFGTRVAFTQMRYVFPVAPAAALLAALGFRAFIADRWQPVGAAIVVACALLFQMLLITRLVLPHAIP